MAYSLPRIFDCNQSDDLLAKWPVVGCVHASETAVSLAFDLDGWTLNGADLDKEVYDIDAATRTITVNNDGLANAAIARSRYFQNTLTLRTFAALRAAWQADRIDDAYDMHRVDLWPLLNRIVTADIAAMTARMAYESRQDGDALWHHALGEADGDIALDYARTLHRTPDAQADASALASSFLQWFERDTRAAKCDFQTLAEMDADLKNLDFNGRGMLTEGAIKCLAIDPLDGRSYLGSRAADIAGNPAWRSITDPIAEAHFAQIIGDIGTTRIGPVTIRDKKLAARLFPEALVQA
jgi:hypothetical protein